MRDCAERRRAVRKSLPLRTSRRTPLGAAMLARVTWALDPARRSAPVAAQLETREGSALAREGLPVGSAAAEELRHPGSGGIRGPPSPLLPRSRARREPPLPGGMEEACQVSLASDICSINILVHGNMKLGGKNKVQSRVQHFASSDTLLQIISLDSVKR